MWFALLESHAIWSQCTYRSVAEVNLVANDNERKVFGVTWACLDEELVAPTLQGLERVWNGHVIDQDAAVGTPVERNAEALKPLLSGCVPDLQHERNDMIPCKKLHALRSIHIYLTCHT